MKSKFSSIVRVKKQALDRAEAKVAIARANVATYELNLNNAKAELNSFGLIKSGNVNELKQELYKLNIMRDEVATLSEKLNLAQRELAHFTHQYKNANLDYEKMKYLEQEDFKLAIKIAKQKEALMLDEFATIKFSAKKAGI